METMEGIREKLAFYNGRKVLITGHTGFKGSWMACVLQQAGAEVSGYALPPISEPSLFSIADITSKTATTFGDIRNLESLRDAMTGFAPEIVIHMAAQPLVLESYRDPVYTYETNVMGTVNLLEAARSCSNVRSIVNVTTDKVYKNNEWAWGYREDEYLDGFDPYSNSKSCSELVTSSYRKSFFSGEKAAVVSTMRAGNVIGGGDFSENRIIPDCVRAAENHSSIILRNPDSTRPYQHVLEPVCAYLLLAALQYDNPSLAGSYNVGPDDSSCVTTKQLAELFCDGWGDGLEWQIDPCSNAPHEANFLKLDSSKIRNAIGWTPKWTIEQAVEKTVEWSKAYIAGGDINSVMTHQIAEYLYD